MLVAGQIDQGDHVGADIVGFGEAHHAVSAFRPAEERVDEVVRSKLRIKRQTQQAALVGGGHVDGGKGRGQQYAVLHYADLPGAQLVVENASARPKGNNHRKAGVANHGFHSKRDGRRRRIARRVGGNRSRGSAPCAATQHNNQQE
jgi:hypothetical protein